MNKNTQQDYCPHCFESLNDESINICIRQLYSPLCLRTLIFVSASSQNDGSPIGLLSTLGSDSARALSYSFSLRLEFGKNFGVSGASLMHDFVLRPSIRYTALTRIEECRPYLLCIRPPCEHNDSFITRLYHKDSKEIVIAIDSDPPVKVYCAEDPDNFGIPLFGLCCFFTDKGRPFFVMYNGRLVCRWGGEMVAKLLPYERGPSQQSLL